LENEITGIVAEVEGTGPDSLEHNITRFAQVLRHLGVRVSLAETMDAMAALARVDLLSRSQFRGALRACLAKSSREAGIFDQAFDLFFTSAEEKLRRQKLRREMQQERERLIAGAQEELMGVMDDWQGELPEKIALTDMQLETYSLLPAEEKERMKEILEKMKANPVNNPGELINRVLQSSLNYWRYYMMKNLKEKGQSGQSAEAPLTGDEELDEVIQSVTADFYRAPGDRIMHQDMENLDEGDLPRVTALINHVSAQLALGMSRRYKRSSRPVAIDIRRTVRRNIKFGGLPLELKFKSRRKKRPSFLLICDVSASMARYARFVLQFIYGLSSAVKNIESFIFSEDIERITPFFRQHTNFSGSMADIMNASSQWGKSTNLYQSLKTFKKLYDDVVTRETIVFIVSDTKTIAPLEAAGLLGQLQRKCGELIWLNTLPAKEWEKQPQIWAFKKIAAMYQCNTIGQLEKAVRKHVLGKI
jgi:uncharacterized protein with von Willebrand factor type A (vWA) domain